jgi:hypothetical protein
MAKSTTVVWATFPSREQARQIKERLTANGFAKNSIEIYRQADGPGCDVAVHTSERNLPRVERLLHASGPVYALRQISDGAIRTLTRNPLVIGGGLALAGLAAYALLPRNRRSTVHSIRELPNTLRHLPETVANVARSIPDSAREVSEAVYNRTVNRDAARDNRPRS